MSPDESITMPHPRSKVQSMTPQELSTAPNTMRNVSFAVVDFETTGLNPETDRIVQLAAIIVNGEGDIVDSFDTIVKPENPAEYQHGAEHIHGITAEQVSSGMPLREALEQLWAINDGRIFTAHNAPPLTLVFFMPNLNVLASKGALNFTSTLWNLHGAPQAQTPPVGTISLHYVSTTASNETRCMMQGQMPLLLHNF